MDMVGKFHTSTRVVNGKGVTINNNSHGHSKSGTLIKSTKTEIKFVLQLVALFAFTSDLPLL